MKTCSKQRPLAHEATIYPSRLQPGASLDLDCGGLFLQTGDIDRQAFAAPIHFAVARGHDEVVLRALACRPQQLSVELIACTLAHGHTDVAKIWLAKKDRLDPTYRYVSRSRTTSVEARVVARDAPELLVLLKVFAPKVNRVNALASAIQARAASAAITPWVGGGESHDHGRCAQGLLALAMQMHHDGQRCTSNAMSGAAINTDTSVASSLSTAAQGQRDVLAYLMTHLDDAADSLCPARVSLPTLASALDGGHVDFVATLLRTVWSHGSVALVQLLDDYITSLSLPPPRRAHEPT
ncbi:hypothetical protein SDRG_14345 [Saprolegnia diclina VS20]|uniref:Uncharacterized protein n=1 Tax=Saprolegnia diclina (strain VS20) TaxID=1156394 RepID=T0PR02_SAPDV|nr:hypothetical protein SDRG_14345 [Saprolegnia diclina VS20]EQC27924.1 hypothetical protein SDRG_14345 [Saprolegnia diclina VS20]|eukprot:XP_008618689.1 hypothetical protein SDRG_14345 [Saprolegnia diclina VS20]